MSTYVSRTLDIMKLCTNLNKKFPKHKFVIESTYTEGKTIDWYHTLNIKINQSSDQLSDQYVIISKYTLNNRVCVNIEFYPNSASDVVLSDMYTLNQDVCEYIDKFLKESTLDEN